MLSNVYGVGYLLLAAILISQKNMTIGELIMGYQFLQLFSEPINRVAQILLRYKTNREHFDRIDSLNGLPDLNPDYENRKVPMDHLARFENFSLYTDLEHKNHLLSVDSLQFPTTGLVLVKGQNGTGKSMLMNLILGLIDPGWTQGTFQVNADIAHTAYLTYPLLFINGTFQENIFSKVYDPALLNILNIDFIGKDIVTNPINLSLGQQQKIALLRILSMKERFLFLDEPYSNLDQQTQNALKNHLSNLKKTTGIIIITHDDDLDEIADELYILQDHTVKRR
jgi:ABC-type bacteriocin/lantibiotic exporter with double-glycine peptidase domain